MSDFWEKDSVVEHPDFWKNDPAADEKVNPLVDAAKGGVSGLAQGVIAIPGMAGDLSQLAKAGVDKVTEKTGSPDPLGYITGKLDENFPNAMKFFRDSNAKSANSPAAKVGSGNLPGSYEMPTSADIQGQVEKATGPFYQAQTGLGKAVQTAGQVAPMLATGGEGLLPTAVKAAASGGVSEGAGEAADALKGHLPGAIQPYAEPVARAVGAVAGSFTPAGARRAVTPLPMTDERMQMVHALNQTNPELVNATSAGQLTESPRIAALEGRAPRMADLPQRQEAAYTQGVMRQAGAPSGAMFDAPGMQAAKGNGDIIDILRNSHTMPNADFEALKRYGRDERLRIRPQVGHSKPLENVQTEIARDPTRATPTPATNMPGERYGALKQITQSAVDNAPTTHEQMALANVRGRMIDNFHGSMPPEEADTLRKLDQQYSNYKTIEGIPTKPDSNTLTPQQVFPKARQGSDLETHADQASQLMRPLPPRNTEVSDITALLGSLGGTASHGAAGYAAGGLAGAVAGAGEGALTGLFTAPHYINAAKDIAGKVAASPAAQSYLKNQLWRPGPYTSADPAMIARLLMTPPVSPIGPYRGENLGPLRSKE
jgi:hypothetical protein